MNPGEKSNHPVELLSAWIDGELKPAEAGALESHMEGCAECRWLIEDFRKLEGAISDETPPDVPADLRQRILAGLASRPASAPAPFWKQAMPLAAAASLVMAFLLWYGRPDRLPPLHGSEPIPLPAPTVPNDAPAPPPPPPPVPPGSMRAARPLAGKTSKVERSDDAPAREKKVEAAFEELGRMAPASPSPAAASANAVPDATAPAAGAAPPAPERESAAPHALHRQEAATESAKASRSEDERLERLRSLGYNGPDESAGGAVAGSAGSAAGGDAKERVQASAARPGPAGQVPEPAAMMKAATPQSPGLFAPPYTVRLVADRRMLVQSGQYACTAWVDDADGRRIAAALQESERVRPPSPPPAAAEADAPATVIAATPEAREVILRLVRVSYRRALESRCGPLPN